MLAIAGGDAIAAQARYMQVRSVLGSLGPDLALLYPVRCSHLAADLRPATPNMAAFG